MASGERVLPTASGFFKSCFFHAFISFYKRIDTKKSANGKSSACHLPARASLVASAKTTAQSDATNSEGLF